MGRGVWGVGCGEGGMGGEVCGGGCRMWEGGSMKRCMECEYM